MPSSLGPKAPRQIVRDLLNTGDKVNAREVDEAARGLRANVEALDPAPAPASADALRAIGVQNAVDLLERMGAGEPIPRRQDFPETLVDAIDTAVVTPQTHKTTTQHGALLRTLLEESPGAGRLSFGELAVAKTGALFEEVSREVAALGPGAVPHDPGVKATRKKLLKLRDFMDIFVHAYARGPAEATWRALRKRLDEGYEAIGRFKDLFDGQGLVLVAPGEAPEAGRSIAPDQVRYVDGEVEARRSEMLAFCDAFVRPEAQQEMRAFLANPSSKPARVADKHLPRFFWGDLGIAPRARESGIEALRRLGAGMAEFIRGEIGSIEDVKKIRNLDDENVVHDARKRMRSLVNLVANVPELSPGSGDAQDARAILIDAVGRYGELSDAFVALHLAHARGDDQGEAKLQDRVDGLWSALREWQGDKGLRGALRDIAVDMTPAR